MGRIIQLITHFFIQNRVQMEFAHHDEPNSASCLKNDSWLDHYEKFFEVRAIAADDRGYNDLAQISGNRISVILNVEIKVGVVFGMYFRTVAPPNAPPPIVYITLSQFCW